MYYTCTPCTNDSKFCGTCKAILAFRCLMAHDSVCFSFVCIGGHRIKETGHSEGGAEGSDGKVDNMNKYFLGMRTIILNAHAVTFGDASSTLKFLYPCYCMVTMQ